MAFDELARRRLARPSRAEPDAPVLRWAAVAAIVAPDPDALLLVRRAERAGDPWSGHIALPGGRRDPEDGDLLFTAIRETREEVGIGLSPEQLLGVLDDVAPRTPVLPPVAVRPFVFRLAARPVVTLSEEVTEAHWVPVADLLARETWGEVTLDVGGAPRRVPAFRLAAGTVWGMTERILSDLLR